MMNDTLDDHSDFLDREAPITARVTLEFCHDHLHIEFAYAQSFCCRIADRDGRRSLDFARVTFEGSVEDITRLRAAYFDGWDAGL